MQTPSAMASASVKARLLADQRRLDASLDRMVATLARDGSEKLRTLWDELELGLLVQLENEESFLIPALLRARPRDAYVLLQEHRHIRVRLHEVGAGAARGVASYLDIRNFRDELRAHSHTEARLLYQWHDERAPSSSRPPAGS